MSAPEPTSAPLVLTRHFDAPRELVFAAFDAGHADMTQGWGGTFDHLAQHLAEQLAAATKE